MEIVWIDRDFASVSAYVDPYVTGSWLGWQVDLQLFKDVVSRYAIGKSCDVPEKRLTTTGDYNSKILYTCACC